MTYYTISEVLRKEEVIDGFEAFAMEFEKFRDGREINELIVVLVLNRHFGIDASLRSLDGAANIKDCNPGSQGNEWAKVDQQIREVNKPIKVAGGARIKKYAMDGTFTPMVTPSSLKNKHIADYMMRVSKTASVFETIESVLIWGFKKTRNKFTSDVINLVCESKMGNSSRQSELLAMYYLGRIDTRQFLFQYEPTNALAYVFEKCLLAMPANQCEKKLEIFNLPIDDNDK